MSSNIAQPQQGWSLHSFWYPVELWKFLPAIQDDPEGYWQGLHDILRLNGFPKKLYAVASLGFLASSYSLFATSTIWPALDFVYSEQWNQTFQPGEALDLVTLAGIIIGMVLFGHLADRVGRKRLYGLELIIIVFSTIGIVLSSEGYKVAPGTGGKYSGWTVMNIFAAVTTWRFFLGIGIGAEYPMSAIIAAEFVSTEMRGRTMAAVFLMQSVGRFLASLFANAFIWGQLNKYEQNVEGLKLLVDATWRFVAGLGGLFAFSAIILRLTIPESPRYYPGIGEELRRALEPAENVGDSGAESSPPWLLAAWRYSIRPGNRRRILVMCLLWLLLDICFCGTGLDSPSTLNLLWLTAPPSNTATAAAAAASSSSWTTSTPTPPWWEIDPSDDKLLLNQVLEWGNSRALEVSCISSLAGSILIILLIDRISRRRLLCWTSAALSVLFIITAMLILTEFAKRGSVASRVFYALCQFVFNLGPNTIVFILAAESFPTMLRWTLYGLSAACGKAGAMIIRPAVQAVAHDARKEPLACMLIAFGVTMLVIALLTQFRFLFPDVQEKVDDGGHYRLLNRHLEDIMPDLQPGELSLSRSAESRTGSDQDLRTPGFEMENMSPEERQYGEGPSVPV